VTPEDRWREIERIYHLARERPRAAWEAFVAAESADVEIRREVASLLGFETAADQFLERPAIEVSARAEAFGREPLEPGHRVADYEIRSRLGAGGMGEVYRGWDVRLEREVALKVVERTAAFDPAQVSQLENEARAASGLAHPNIVTIYAVGEDAGLAYIAMELVQGRTLREMAAQDPLPMSTALDIGVQLVDALTAAHAAGIVHRDLTPDNVMVTAGGLVKVLDFGIAKRSRRPESSQGLVVGTAGYMSPEQAAGQPAGPASDQFSFGAVLYELLSGQRAFDRETTEDTLAAVRTSSPVPVHHLNAAVPAGARRIVERCLAKRPEDRFASTRELANAVTEVRDAWRHEQAPLLTRRRAIALGLSAAASAVAGVAAWKIWPAAPRLRSLAVLPFGNPAQNPEIDYLCDGLTEALLRRLSLLDGLDVRARSAVFNFKRASVDPATAGRRLGVGAVLTGTVERRDGRLNVQASLFDLQAGREVWRDRYDRPVADLVALQHDLARAIVEEGIHHPLDAAERRRFHRAPTEDSEANDLYLRGLHRHREEGEQGYLAARRLLQAAVARDPTFALAHVSLASTYSVMTLDGFERPTEAWPNSNRAVRCALTLDPDLPEAHAEQATAWFAFDHDWASAESAWRHALRAGGSPTLPDLLSGAAIMHWAVGRLDEALALTRRARALDAVSPRFAVLEADLLLHAGRPAKAVTIYEAVLAEAPDHTPAAFGLAEAWRDQGRFDLAVDAQARGHAAAGNPLPDGLTRRRDRAGHAAIERFVVERELDGFRQRAARDEYVSPLDVARGHARLGERDRAFEWLDAAFVENSPGLVFLNVDRAWAGVRDDRRFAAASAAVGLPDAWSRPVPRE
jgi:serine/threonine-protein kinase